MVESDETYIEFNDELAVAYANYKRLPQDIEASMTFEQYMRLFLEYYG